MTIEIISHRGYWKKESEKNSEAAFSRSFELGFGTETDIRDSGGELVISHDVPTGDEMSFNDFLQIHRNIDPTLPLAINVKSDGLQEKLLSELLNNCVENYFVFDMSIPDTLGYIRSSANVFLRFSEYEGVNLLWDDAMGIWWDGFCGLELNTDVINAVSSRSMRICFVSPELHNRDEAPAWAELKLLASLKAMEGLMLCTDKPEEARVFFNG